MVIIPGLREMACRPLGPTDNSKSRPGSIRVEADGAAGYPSLGKDAKMKVRVFEEYRPGYYVIARISIECDMMVGFKGRGEAL